MLASLQEKVAWITGAGSGIGQAVAVTLATQGARVVLSGRRKDPLLETADMITKSGSEYTIEVLDVSHTKEVHEAIARIEERYARLDILVNNAGINVTDRHWKTITPDKWDRVIATDLSGAFYCTLAVLPIMRRQKDGLIINISSWAGHFYSMITGPAYTSAKHGLRAMNETINMEECINGIRACVICPGEVWTPILDHRPDALSDAIKATMLRPEDISEAVLFVTSLPKRVCVNELVISPTMNRTYLNYHDRPR